MTVARTHAHAPEYRKNKREQQLHNKNYRSIYRVCMYNNDPSLPAYYLLPSLSTGYAVVFTFPFSLSNVCLSISHTRTHSTIDQNKRSLCIDCVFEFSIQQPSKNVLAICSTVVLLCHIYFTRTRLKLIGWIILSSKRMCICCVTFKRSFFFHCIFKMNEEHKHMYRHYEVYRVKVVHSLK